MQISAKKAMICYLMIVFFFIKSFHWWKASQEFPFDGSVTTLLSLLVLKTNFSWCGKIADFSKNNVITQYVVTLNDMLFKNQLKIPSSLGKYTC